MKKFLIVYFILVFALIFSFKPQENANKECFSVWNNINSVPVCIKKN